MKILVTGGRGFIGSHLVDRLRQDKHRVMVFDKKQGKDINNFFQLKQAVEKNKFDVVIHLAAQTGVRRSFEEPELYQRTNILGTINLLECLRQSTGTMLVFTSSSSVYGNSKIIPFQEDDLELQPVSIYGATKRAAELACQAYARNYGIKTTILRLFTVYGPNNRRDMAAFTFTRDIMAGKPIRLFGEKTERDFTYVADIVEGIVRAIRRPVNYEVINLGNAAPVRVREFIKLIEKFTGKKAEIQIDKLPMGDAKKTWANIDKARKLLGWKPKTNLQQGVEKLVNWYMILRSNARIIL